MAAPAQLVDGRWRTEDVFGCTASFQQLALPAALRRALALAGFKHPSPVQEVAIPLARVGSDLVVQAKSGTGKSLVFAVACLERVAVCEGSPQALVVCPTRELAQQCSAEISRLSANLPGLPVNTGVFIGGVPVGADQKALRRNCQVVVGTPGRLAWLVQSNVLSTKDMKVMVLDEADQLFSPSMQDEVEFLMSRMPTEKQFLAFSATYTEDILGKIEAQMRLPQRVFVSTDASNTLLGVHHCYKVVEPSKLDEDANDGSFGLKTNALIEVFNSVAFHQALVFCNNQTRAAELSEKLTRKGFPSEFISGMTVQQQRGETLAAMRKFKLRVTVSTDLMARGIDLERVNLVCNLDLPISRATYQHRLGRTGRFGTFGLVVSIVSRTELDQLARFAEQSGGTVEPLPLDVPQEWYRYDLKAQGDKVAYKNLLHAPVSPEPMRHFKRAKSMMDLGENESEGLRFWSGYMASRSEFWDSWDPYTARDVGQDCNSQEQTISTHVLLPTRNSKECIPCEESMPTSAKDQSTSERNLAKNNAKTCESEHRYPINEDSRHQKVTTCNVVGEESSRRDLVESNGEDYLKIALDNALKNSRYGVLSSGAVQSCKESIRPDPERRHHTRHKANKHLSAPPAAATERVPDILHETMPEVHRSAHQAWLKGYNAWGEAYAEWLGEYREWMILYEACMTTSQSTSQEDSQGLPPPS